jgi:hypothetical protein
MGGTTEALVHGSGRDYAGWVQGGAFMRANIILIAAALPLAACDRQPEVHAENASVGEVEKQVREASAAGSFIRPGKWLSKTSVEEISIPGMPADMADQMKQTIAQRQGQEFESCLTEADVKRPKEDFFTGKDNQCRYDHFTMAGGKIDAKLRCGDGGASQVMTMAGSYSPESYEMRMTMKAEAEGTQGAMAMQMRTEARRFGECTAKG